MISYQTVSVKYIVIMPYRKAGITVHHFKDAHTFYSAEDLVEFLSPLGLDGKSFGVVVQDVYNECLRTGAAYDTSLVPLMFNHESPVLIGAFVS